jgi:septal ring factor EnvC (AmiA/AmiB activator)
MTLAEAWDLTMRDIEEVKVAISALQAENERLCNERDEESQEWLECQAENARLRTALGALLREGDKFHCGPDGCFSAVACDIARAALGDDK